MAPRYCVCLCSLHPIYYPPLHFAETDRSNGRRDAPREATDAIKTAAHKSAAEWAAVNAYKTPCAFYEGFLHPTFSFRRHFFFGGQI